MIDKSKNAIYVNTIHYISSEGGVKSFVLYSHHGICTKRFKEFLDKYIEKYVKDFRMLTEEWGGQETISNESFCY